MVPSPLYCPHCGKEITGANLPRPLRPFKILFDKSQKPLDIPSIKRQLSDFSESYDRVVKTIIANSTSLDKDTFMFNVARLMPSFGMTRRGIFYGVKIENGIVRDPNHVLDACWAQAEDELQDLKEHISGNVSNHRSRAILELPTESKSYVVAEASALFDKLEWTTITGSNVGRVAASKILFAVLPEIALPVDNTEWDYVFRTHDYGRVLSTMIDEINEWERKSKTHLETLDSNVPTTLTSIYNVMAMSARPPAR